MKRVVIVPYYVEIDSGYLSEIVHAFNSVTVKNMDGETLKNYCSVGKTIKYAISDLGYGYVSVKGLFERDGFMVSEQTQRVIYEIAGADPTKVVISLKIAKKYHKRMNLVAILVVEDNNGPSKTTWTDIEFLRVVRIGINEKFDPKCPDRWLNCEIDAKYLLEKGVRL